MILEFLYDKLVRSLFNLCLNTSSMENSLSPNAAHSILTLISVRIRLLLMQPIQFLKTHPDTKVNFAPSCFSTFGGKSTILGFKT